MTFANQLRSVSQELARHQRIIWALSLREVITRYGRENLGFLWVMGEPLLFCIGVSVMWTVIKPSYEHGIRIVPFVVTGYMPLLLVRHVLQHGMYAVRMNAALLYHRQITTLHLFFARCIVEIIGVTFAFILMLCILLPFDLIELPKNLYLLYGGWFLLAWISFGLAVIFGSIFELFEPIERFVTLITYMLVPLSGAFYMVSWLPSSYRGLVMLIPFVNTVEMMRAGFFGDSVHTYYNVPYTIAWAAGFTVLGLLLSISVRRRVYVE
jgi:capsular polysaccharide transport system permease protein